MLQPRAIRPLRRTAPEGHNRRAERELGLHTLEPRTKLGAGQGAAAAFCHFLPKQLDRGQSNGKTELPEREAQRCRLPQPSLPAVLPQPVLSRREQTLQESFTFKRSLCHELRDAVGVRQEAAQT